MTDAGAAERSAPDVVVLIPAEPVADDPWLTGAVDAAGALRAAGLDVDVRIGVPAALPRAGVTVCHGVQYAHLLTQAPAHPVVSSDLLPAGEVDGVTAVDWCWPALSARAGAFAASIARRRVGLIAGPPVPTQRRVVAAFAEAVGAGVAAVHVPRFDALEMGRRTGEFLVDGMGCDVVAHTADGAGVAGLVGARRAGARTIGFLSHAPGDVAWISSDISGTLAHLVLRARDGEAMPRLFAADEASGFARFDVRADAAGTTLG